MSVDKARADLARLKDEEADLCAARDAAEKHFSTKISENRQQQEKIAAFIEMQAIYGTPEATTALSPGPVSSNPALAVPQTPPPFALTTAATSARRRPYGTMIAAVQLCTEILRETGRPWHTRDLLEELERRGLVLGGTDPVVSLSNRLGRSNLVRSHRVLGWHLAEWPDFPDPTEERIAILRVQMQKNAEANARFNESSGVDVATNDQPFQGIGLPDAAIAVIAKHGKPLRNTEIVARLEEDGFPFVQKDHSGAVETVLRRRMNSNSDIARANLVVRVAPGTWGLAKWFSKEELDGFSASLGGVPGRDLISHLERTRAGVQAAKARGVHFGLKSKLSDAEMEQAREMYANGATIGDLAKIFEVSKSGAGKWVAKWLAEAKTDEE